MPKSSATIAIRASFSSSPAVRLVAVAILNADVLLRVATPTGQPVAVLSELYRTQNTVLSHQKEINMVLCSLFSGMSHLLVGYVAVGDSTADC